MAARPSMRHVAARAGVSLQTVSRVVNEPDKVAPATRDRVRAVIDAVGYRPNLVARSMRSERSGLIGIMVNGTSARGPSAAIARLVYAARSRGLATMVCSVFEEDAAAARDSLDLLLGQNVDGLLVVATMPWIADVAVDVAEQSPVVVIQSAPHGEASQFRVSTDQETGVRLVVDHLLEQGYRTMMHVSGPDDWFDGQVRTEAWRRLMREHELVEQVIGGVSFEPKSGYEAVVQWFDGGGDVPEAVFAANDFLAVGVIRALHEHGLRVPEDVAVVGFDNSIDADFRIPRISSVEQNFGELVEESLELLIGAMAGEKPRTVLIAPELVVRDSSVR